MFIHIWKLYSSSLSFKYIGWLIDWLTDWFVAALKSNVRNTEVARVTEVFKPRFVRIFRRKRLSRPIPYYHSSTSTRRIILFGEIKPNPKPKNLKKYPIVKLRIKQRAATRKTCNKTILTQKGCHKYRVKREHITAQKVFVFGVILVRIFPAFSHIWTEYEKVRSISPYSVRMRENAGKMRTRVTPNTD